MDRNTYLAYRTQQSAEPLYEYYKEHHKGGVFLDREAFIRAIQFWPHSTKALEKVLHEYDVKFGVISVQDLKTGQIIKYI